MTLIDFHAHFMNCIKRGCVFSMVIWPAFRMGQYRANDHPYHAPQFNARDIYFGNYYVFLILVTDYGKLLNLIYMSSNRIKLSLLYRSDRRCLFVRASC